MSETKIFPPPWTWEYHPDTREAIALTSPSGDVLLATGDERHSWLAASDAHLRALMAVPSMLNALTKILAGLRSRKGTDGEGKLSISEVMAMKMAIEEATGEKP